MRDSFCPECHGPPVLVLVKLRSLVKRCEDCGHRWNEPRPAPAFWFQNGYVRFRQPGAVETDQ